MSSTNLEYENEPNPDLVASMLDESIELNMNNDKMSIAKNRKSFTELEYS